MPAIPRTCWKGITFRPWLAILDLKSSHMELQLGERRILRPFLMLSEAKLTHFTLLQTPPMARIATLALNMRLPTIFEHASAVRNGGLMSYGADLADLFRRAANFVDKILRGAKPGELPIEQPTKFNLAINLKTAEALGLSVPPELLTIADEVIE